MGITAASLGAFGSAMAAALAGTFPGILRIGASSYQCAATTGKMSRVVEGAGVVVEVDAVVFLAAAVLAGGVPPATGARVQLDGTDFRVIHRAWAPAAAAWELWLEQAG